MSAAVILVDDEFAVWRRGRVAGAPVAVDGLGIAWTAEELATAGAQIRGVIVWQQTRAERGDGAARARLPVLWARAVAFQNARAGLGGAPLACQVTVSAGERETHLLCACGGHIVYVGAPATEGWQAVVAAFAAAHVPPPEGLAV